MTTQRTNSFVQAICAILLIALPVILSDCGGRKVPAGPTCLYYGYAYDISGRLVSATPGGACSCGGAGECNIRYNDLGQKMESCVCK